MSTHKLPIWVPNEYPRLYIMKLTIKQSVDYTGKSANTIRRLLKKYSKTTHEYSRYFRKIGGKYYIDKAFLQKYYNIAEEKEDNQAETGLLPHFLEHLKQENMELHARVKELTHVVAHQSQQLASKDEQLRLLSAAPESTESTNVTGYFIVLMVVVAVIIGTMIIWMILGSR